MRISCIRSSHNVRVWNPDLLGGDLIVAHDWQRRCYEAMLMEIQKCATWNLPESPSRGCWGKLSWEGISQEVLGYEIAQREGMPGKCLSQALQKLGTGKLAKKPAEQAQVTRKQTPCSCTVFLAPATDKDRHYCSWQTKEQTIQGPRFIFREQAKRVNLEVRGIELIIHTRQQGIPHGGNSACQGRQT